MKQICAGINCNLDAEPKDVFCASCSTESLSGIQTKEGGFFTRDAPSHIYFDYEKFRAEGALQLFRDYKAKNKDFSIEIMSRFAVTDMDLLIKHLKGIKHE